MHPMLQVPLTGSQDGMLIMELVAGMRPVKETLQRYGLDEPALTARFKDKLFMAAYKEAKKMWESDLNVHERVRFKSAMLVEQALPAIYAILADSASGAAARLEAFKQLTTQGTPKDAKSAGGSQFSVVIVTGPRPTDKVEIHGQQRVIEGQVDPA